MQNKDGIQKGPQDHAEGQHGSKTHSRFIEQLHSHANNSDDESGAAVGDEPRHHIARHNAEPRLFGDREQHDEAEKRSEKTRLHRELDRRNADERDIPRGTG